MVFLGALSIIGIMAVQIFWIKKTWDLKDQEFHRTVNIALIKASRSLADLNGSVLPSKDLIKKAASNYYVVNFNDVIHAGELEFYLQKEFDELALNVNFEYAIYDCANDEMVYGNYCMYSEDAGQNVKLGNLPKYDEFTYYFGVKFPDRKSYLLGEMQLSMVFTLILLMAIIFFIYSLFIILRQKRVSEMQKDFVNNMTHEFKTPISTIKISADVFLNNEMVQSDPRLHRYASIIKDQNQRLNMQVEKVLQLARIERDGFKLNKEEVDLHGLLKDTMQSVELKVGEKKGQLSSQLNATSSMVNADRLHLTNILHNLLDNAIKYCKKSPSILIETENKNNQVSLSIKDSGIGISEEDQAKVFDKFYRVSTGNVHNVKGFGLGLFYIKSICEAHHWKMNLESELDVGTTITITMLLSKAKHS